MAERLKWGEVFRRVWKPMLTTGGCPLDYHANLILDAQRAAWFLPLYVLVKAEFVSVLDTFFEFADTGVDETLH